MPSAWTMCGCHFFSTMTVCGIFVILVKFVPITVQDTSQPNNSPRLINFKGFARVKENSAVGTVINTITATDQDGPDPVSFSINTNSLDTVLLVELGIPTGSSSTGRSVDLLLKVGDLDSDFNPQERYLSIQVHDGINDPVLALLTLFIEEINDWAPEFTNLPCAVSIKEDALTGTLVFNGTETYDPDTGLGGSVSYTLEDIDVNHGQPFWVSADTGYVYINEPLDYERFNSYKLMLRAADGEGLSSIAEIMISVEDVQDTPPSFTQQRYKARILTNAARGTAVLVVSASDGDKEQPNPVTYKFAEPIYYNVFKIDNSTGLITVNGDLESCNCGQTANGSRQVDLTVMAEEINQSLPQKGMTTAITLVTIYIDDVNTVTPTIQSDSSRISTACEVCGTGRIQIVSMFALFIVPVLCW